MVAVGASAPCRGVAAVAPHMAGRVDAALCGLCLDRVRHTRPTRLGRAHRAPTVRLASGSGARTGPAGTVAGWHPPGGARTRAPPTARSLRAGGEPRQLSGCPGARGGVARAAALRGQARTGGALALAHS